MKAWFMGKYDLTPISRDECKQRGLPCHWWSRPLFDFRLDPENPLTFCREDGFQAQPCKEFVTDGGSIPNVVQIIPAFDKFRYPASYGFHDSAYKKHLWWTRQNPSRPFTKTRLSFSEANNLLHDMLLTEGAWEATANTVYCGVQAFGWLAW